ncbi:MAG: hypothetical protein BWY83_02319 [bacterium ADurb.Bin478]|nr:MAG: hypothetical protein BWY83_02319 [bacterium ADurb.Bin478]
MNLMRAFADEKETAEDQNQVSSRDLLTQDREKRLGQPHQPGQGQQQADAGEHGQSQAHDPAVVALRDRQFSHQDGDEDDIVNAQNDL